MTLTQTWLWWIQPSHTCTYKVFWKFIATVSMQQRQIFSNIYKAKENNINHSINRATIIYTPSNKTWNIIIAVKDLQIITEARCVLFNVKVKEVEADPLTVAYTNVPVANLFILVAVWITRGTENLLLICVHSSTFFCCKTVFIINLTITKHLTV